jgi:hypothetical protein
MKPVLAGVVKIAEGWICRNYVSEDVIMSTAINDTDSGTCGSCYQRFEGCRPLKITIEQGDHK